jgi:hypothetical protein
VDASHETTDQWFKEVSVKKLVVLVGFAAAVYGAKKILSGKEEETSQSYGTTEYASNGYAPPSQDEQAA